MSLITEARAMARAAHRGQVRKYTNEPYTNHLKRVAELVQKHVDNETAVAVSWLHDIVEDTPTTLDDILDNFGHEVAAMITDLTSTPRVPGYNRGQRKAMDRLKLSNACELTQSVKLADIADNVLDIATHDPSFAEVYLEEKELMLHVLKYGNLALYRIAAERLKQSKEILCRS